MLAAKLQENLTVALNYSGQEHTEWRTTDNV